MEKKQKTEGPCDSQVTRTPAGMEYVTASNPGSAKSAAKIPGPRLVLYGLIMVIVGFGVTFLLALSGFQYSFFLLFVPLAGIILAIKGIMRSLGL